MLKKIGLLLCASLALTSAMAASDKKTTTLAITLIADHPALNDAYHGIMDGLKQKGYIEGENLKILYADAKGNVRMAEEIARDFVKQKPAVIIPISTPSAQAVLKANQEAKIPVVFSAVTDPIAAKLVPTLKQPGGFVTGVYDYPPIAQQLQIIREILPQIKTLGVIYNKDEINSVRMVEDLKSSAGALTIIEATATAFDQIAPATRSLIGKVDAIYTPADNLIATGVHVVLDIATENRIPVFSSEHGSVQKGALASLAYNQHEVGLMTADLVIAILNGKNPGTLDVEKPQNPQLMLNPAVAKTLNITIPESLQKMAMD